LGSATEGHYLANWPFHGDCICWACWGAWSLRDALVSAARNDLVDITAKSQA